MATYADLVAEALTEIGVLERGEDAQDVQVTDALRVFADMLDQFTLEGIYVPVPSTDPVAYLHDQELTGASAVSVPVGYRRFLMVSLAVRLASANGRTMDRVALTAAEAEAAKNVIKDRGTRKTHDSGTYGAMVEEALTEIGVLMRGETILDHDMADGLRVFHDMVNNWTLEGIEIPKPGTDPVTFLHEETFTAANALPVPETHRRALMLNLAVRMAALNNRPVEALQLVTVEATALKEELKDRGYRRASPAGSYGAMVEEALTEIGVLMRGETILDHDMADGLRVFHDMVNNWTLEGIKIPKPGANPAAYLHDETFTAADALPVPPSYRRALMTNLAVRLGSLNNRSLRQMETVIIEAGEGKEEILTRGQRDSADEGSNGALVEEALTEIGVLLRGETILSHDMEDGLRILGDMLDEWALEGGLVPVEQRTAVDVTQSATEFTLGTGEAINVIAPHDISNIFYRPSWSDDYVRLSETNYAGLRRHANSDYRSFPSVFWYEKTDPASKIFFDQAANPGDRFIVEAPGWFHATTLAEGDTLRFPRGYRRAVMLNLAIRMASINMVSENRLRTTRRDARMAKRIVVSRNVSDRLRMQPDSMLLRSHRSYLARDRLN